MYPALLNEISNIPRQRFPHCKWLSVPWILLDDDAMMRAANMATSINPVRFTLTALNEPPIYENVTPFL
jgi:hypothetical protein